MMTIWDNDRAAGIAANKYKPYNFTGVEGDSLKTVVFGTLRLMSFDIKKLVVITRTGSLPLITTIT